MKYGVHCKAAKKLFFKPENLKCVHKFFETNKTLENIQKKLELCLASDFNLAADSNRNTQFTANGILNFLCL